MKMSERRDVRRNDNCICEVVRAIKRIQDIREDLDCDDCRTDCFLTPLGSLVSPTRQRANTRVFTLIDKMVILSKQCSRHEEERRDRENVKERSWQMNMKETEKEIVNAKMFLSFLQSSKCFRQLLCNITSS